MKNGYRVYLLHILDAIKNIEEFTKRCPKEKFIMAAFDSAFTLGEGAYQYMDENINIQGHEGLLPLLDEIINKKKKAAIAL